MRGTGMELKKGAAGELVGLQRAGGDCGESACRLRARQMTDCDFLYSIQVGMVAREADPQYFGFWNLNASHWLRLRVCL